MFTRPGAAVVLAFALSAITIANVGLGQEGGKDEKKKGDKGKKADPMPAAKDGNYFGTNYVVVSTNLPGSPGTVLKDVKLVPVGTTTYLAGVVPKGLPAPWPQDGCGVMVPVGQITQLSLFGDIEDVKKALAPPKP